MQAPKLSCERQRFRYVARGVSLVVALLVCFGVFLLPLPASGSAVPSGMDMANMSRVDLETNGNAQLLEGIYLVAPGEETEEAQKQPLKAELLTMLVLALCFGLSVGWVLRSAQRQGALCSLAFVDPLFGTVCEDLPFLGVFRL